MDLNQAYCTMMVLCFATNVQPPPDFTPTGCDYYQAPLDGINGNDSFSLKCTDFKQLLAGAFKLKSHQINTLVIDGKNYVESGSISNIIDATSVVFVNFYSFSSRMLQICTNSLQHLMIQDSQLSDSSFPLIDLLEQNFELKSIQIISTKIERIDGTFSVLSRNLHTIVLRNCQIELIDPYSFDCQRLRRLDLSNNLISNFHWVTLNNNKLFNVLWFLDVSNNQITFLPNSLQNSLPNLKVFRLQGNQFIWLSLNSLLPWFGPEIHEFILASQASIIPKPHLYLTKEHSWVRDIAKQKILSLYTVDSLINHFTYITLDGLKDWESLHSKPESELVLKEFPEQLTLTEMEFNFQDINFVTPVPTKVIHKCFRYTDWTSYQDSKIPVPILVNLEGSSETYKESLFNDQDNVNQYGYDWIKLRDTLKSVDQRYQKSKFKAIRIHLFGDSMFKFWNGETNFNQEEFDLILSQAVDFLNNAARFKVYVLFVMWSYEKLASLTSDKMDQMWTRMPDIQKWIIKPLVEKISNHPFLIGIELIDHLFSRIIPTGGLGDKAKNPDPNYQADCPFEDTFKNSIRIDFSFMQLVHTMLLGENFHRPIGVGFNSHCSQCYVYLSLKACISNLPDFFSIHSYVTDNSPHSYKNFITKYPDWFSKSIQVQLDDQHPVGFFIVIQVKQGDSISEEDKKILRALPLGYFEETVNAYPNEKA